MTKIKRELPANSVELLTGNNFAAAIVEGCSLAFWMVGRCDATALYHMNAIHENFANLADALGYDITPKPVADEPAEVAA